LINYKRPVFQPPISTKIKDYGGPTMLQNLSTSLKVNELKDIEINFTKAVQTSEKGQHYVVLENEKYNICLFPVTSAIPNGKKSHIKYNARVHFKQTGILFYMGVRELSSDNALIAGQAARVPGYRAVVTEYSHETGIAHERMAIPDSQYYELMSIIRAGTAA